jgi:hypothetical protein
MRNRVELTVEDAATGETLPGANVVILDQQGNRTTRGGATDADGVVILVDADAAEVRYIGYEPREVPFVRSGEYAMTVLMQPTGYNLPPFEVTATRRKSNPAPLLLLLLILADPS